MKTQQSDLLSLLCLLGRQQDRVDVWQDSEPTPTRCILQAVKRQRLRGKISIFLAGKKTDCLRECQSRLSVSPDLVSSPISWCDLTEVFVKLANAMSKS